MVTTPLRERMRQAMRIRNLFSPHRSDLHSMRPPLLSVFSPSPDRLGRGEIEQYLLFLRDAKRVSWAWFNQTEEVQQVTAVSFAGKDVCACRVALLPPAFRSVDEAKKAVALLTNARSRTVMLARVQSARSAAEPAAEPGRISFQVGSDYFKASSCSNCSTLSGTDTGTNHERG